jgi:pyruvate kinase
MSRRTKIVATLGPAVDAPETLAELLNAGVDVARINFSHGAAEEHLQRITRLRETADKLGKVVAVLGDLPGPKLRVRLPEARELVDGDTVHFSLNHEPGSADELVITEPELLADVRPGQRLLLDDGRLQLVARATVGQRLSTRVLVGGTLHPNKGINLPDTQIQVPAVTPRDRDALATAARVGVDWLALSFVRGPEAAEELRIAAAEFGLKVPVLAKIERPEAVRRVAAIVAAFDGIMVARGDLGVEMPLEQVPTIQKSLITEANTAGKPVITATDMLDSMRNNPRPTRAEASDVANAVYDGSDALMLSGETAIGHYPIEAVRCMARIAEETERHLFEVNRRQRSLELFQPGQEIVQQLAEATVGLAENLGAAAIITPTRTGRTARLLTKYRPRTPVIALGPSPTILRRMAVYWGVLPVPLAPLTPGDDRIVAAVRDAFAANAVAVGDRVVVLAGHPVEGGRHYPTIRVVQVGEGGASVAP